MAWWLQEHDLDFLDTKSDKTIYGFMGGEWWWDVYDIDRALHLCFPKDSVLSWLIKSLRVLIEAFSSSVNRKILQENLSTHLSPYDVRVLLSCLARWRLRLEGLPVNSEMHRSCCVRCNSFLSKMKIKAECAAAAEVFQVWDLPGRSCNGVSRTSCWEVLDGFQRLCFAVRQSSCARTTWDPLPVTSHDTSEMQTPNCIPSNVPENISVLWRLARIMFLFNGHEYAVN